MAGDAPRDWPSAAASAAQRRAWSRDRARDAARFLPVFGLCLILLPDIVLSGDPDAQGATLPWGVALLTIWVLLIALAFWNARVLAAHAEQEGEEGPDGPPAEP